MGVGNGKGKPFEGDAAGCQRPTVPARWRPDIQHARGQFAGLDAFVDGVQLGLLGEQLTAVAGAYRAALDAGADPAEVTAWINETKAKQKRLNQQIRATPRAKQGGRDEITALMERTGDLVKVISKADPADKADLHQQLGLTMTYYPQKQIVEARVIPEPPHVRAVRVRGANTPDRTWPAWCPIGDPYLITVPA